MAKILVVDDEAQIRELLERELKDARHEVMTVPNAEQATSVLSSHPIDLVVLDIRMPGEQGVALLRQIRNTHSRILVVVYSGFIDQALEKELREAGADEVLKKGDVSALRSVVEKTLGTATKAQSSRKKGKILVVDDEKPIRDLLKMFLSSKNYEAVEAESGPSALSVAASGELSAVLLDINMPGMDGLECLRRLLEQNPGLNVVMISGRQDEDTVSQAVKIGARGFIIKPFDFLHLELVLMDKLSQK